MNFSEKRVLITGACGVTSRTIVRALGRSEYFRHAHFIGTDICDNPFALYEGLYEKIYRVPGLQQVQDYQSLIEKICKKERIDAAIVVPEPEVLFWSEREMPVPALLPPPRFARLAISKASLYKQLRGTGLVPDFALVDRDQILAGDFGGVGELPLWIRDFSAGSTSGRGALCVRHSDEAAAWMTLNFGIENFMISEYLPGRNLACLLLFNEGELIKVGTYERLEYFMAKTVPSGVSGNICKGRLINDPVVLEVSRKAVELLCRATGDRMHGLVTVDLRTDAQDRPKVTEINLRQVAAASAFAEVPGANLAEAQLLITLGHAEAAGPLEVTFPDDNRLFRDIDGLPVYVPHYTPLAVGDCHDSMLEIKDRS